MHLQKKRVAIRHKRQDRALDKFKQHLWNCYIRKTMGLRCPLTNNFVKPSCRDLQICNAYLFSNGGPVDSKQIYTKIDKKEFSSTSTVTSCLLNQIEIASFITKAINHLFRGQYTQKPHPFIVHISHMTTRSHS